MKKPVTPQQALVRLETLCARSEQCTEELRRKLASWKLDAQTSEKIIRRLEENRFVDNDRFARSFVHDKYLYSGWGRRKIASALYARRISPETIDNAMATIDVVRYGSLAFKAMKLKLRQLPDSLSREEKRIRLLRFGTGRGYETALVVKIINSDRLWLD